MQSVDLRSVIHGDGNYRLDYKYRHYAVNDVVWRTKNEEQRQMLFQRFLRDSKNEKKADATIISSNGKLAVHSKVKTVAKKPNQRKRPRSERNPSKTVNTEYSNWIEHMSKNCLSSNFSYILVGRPQI